MNQSDNYQKCLLCANTDVKKPFLYCFDCNNNRKSNWKLCSICYTTKIDPSKPYKNCFDCSKMVKELRSGIHKLKYGDKTNKSSGFFNTE